MSVLFVSNRAYSIRPYELLSFLISEFLCTFYRILTTCYSLPITQNLQNFHIFAQSKHLPPIDKNMKTSKQLKCLLLAGFVTFVAFSAQAQIQIDSIRTTLTDGSLLQEIYKQYENGSRAALVEHNYFNEFEQGNTKYEYAYDANGNKILTVEHNQNYNNGMQQQEKYQYDYSDDDKQNLRRYDINWTAGTNKLFPQNKFEYDYDEQGRMTMYAFYTNWKSPTDWQKYEKYECVYTKTGTLAKCVYYITQQD